MNGGYVQLNKSCEKLLMARMNLVKCRGRTRKSNLQFDKKQRRVQRSYGIVEKSQANNIPPQLITI